MEASAGLVAGSHNRDELVVILRESGAGGDATRRAEEQAPCQICGDDVGVGFDGEHFEACNVCAFAICRACYEYERREGSQACPQSRTCYKRLKGCQLVAGDKEDRFDDLEGEFGLQDSAACENAPLSKNGAGPVPARHDAACRAVVPCLGLAGGESCQPGTARTAPRAGTVRPEARRVPGRVGPTRPKSQLAALRNAAWARVDAVSCREASSPSPSLLLAELVDTVKKPQRRPHPLCSLLSLSPSLCFTEQQQQLAEPSSLSPPPRPVKSAAASAPPCAHRCHRRPTVKTGFSLSVSQTQPSTSPAAPSVSLSLSLSFAPSAEKQHGSSNFPPPLPLLAQSRSCSSTPPIHRRAFAPSIKLENTAAAGAASTPLTTPALPRSSACQVEELAHALPFFSNTGSRPLRLPRRWPSAPPPRRRPRKPWRLLERANPLLSFNEAYGTFRARRFGLGPPPSRPSSSAKRRRAVVLAGRRAPITSSGRKAHNLVLPREMDPPVLLFTATVAWFASGHIVLHRRPPALSLSLYDLVRMGPGPTDL